MTEKVLQSTVGEHEAEKQVYLKFDCGSFIFFLSSYKFLLTWFSLVFPNPLNYVIHTFWAKILIPFPLENFPPKHRVRGICSNHILVFGLVYFWVKLGFNMRINIHRKRTKRKNIFGKGSLKLVCLNILISLCQDYGLYFWQIIRSPWCINITYHMKLYFTMIIVKLRIRNHQMVCVAWIDGCH